MRFTLSHVIRTAVPAVVLAALLSVASAAEFVASDVLYWQREDGQTFSARLVGFERGVATFDGQEGLFQIHVNDLHSYSVQALQRHLRTVRAPAEEAESQRRIERAERRRAERERAQQRQELLRRQANYEVAAAREGMGYNNLVRTAQLNNRLAWWAVARRAYWRYPVHTIIDRRHHHDHDHDDAASLASN